MMKPMENQLLRPNKALGQHFLMHARIAERIADSAPLSPESVVLEVGPGTGVLTRALLARASKVIAVEADKGLAEELRAVFADDIRTGRFELIEGDIRAFDLGTLPRGYSVVANIPYYISGELFRAFLESENQPSSLTLLVQKEVAERIARSSKESILSLSVKAYGVPQYAFTVPRGAFRPPPKVDSAVLSIQNISRSRFMGPEEERAFFTLIRAGFAHKRKYLASNLREAGLPAEGVPEKARAEDLPLEAWLALLRAQTR